MIKIRGILNGWISLHNQRFPYLLGLPCLLLLIGYAIPLVAQDQPDLQQDQEEKKPAQVCVIPFQGEVEQALVHVIQRGFEEAKANETVHVIIDMNTPGGRVDAALDIIDLILESDIPVTILVSGDATSAGAIISIAGDQIYMEEGSTIGTAAPVLLGGGESEAMNAKVLSYVRAKVRSICEERGYSDSKTRLFEAMVDKDIEITDPDDPDRFITRKGELLTLTAKEALKLGLVAGILKSHDRSSDTPTKPVELLEKLEIPDAQVVFIVESNFERLARFLSGIEVSSLLLTIAVIGLIWEFRTPGFGLPGLIGISALILFFWGHSIAGLTGWEVPLLLGLGMMLLGLEMFVIPGFGITGILGIFCIFFSLVFTLLDRPPTNPHFWGTFEWITLTRAMVIILICTLTGACFAFILPFLFPLASKTQIGRMFMLMDKEDRIKGYHSAQDNLEQFLGKIGIAKSPLRPAGIATIEGQRVDVVSQGGFIPCNSTVEVIKVEGRRIVVRKA